MNEELERQYFTREQVEAWGSFTMVLGVTAITVTFTILLLFGLPPLDLWGHVFLLLILVPVSYLYRRQYQQTKERSE